jgi:hypothetical protein
MGASDDSAKETRDLGRGVPTPRYAICKMMKLMDFQEKSAEECGSN